MQNNASSNKIIFVKRVRKVAQVLYQRGLLKEGMVQLPRVLMRGNRKPALALNEKATLANRLRLAFEDLGPTFIKLGQALSTRPDIVSQEIAAELVFLQDKVQAFSEEWVKKTVRAELGALPEDLFQGFFYTPIASASIAQVHLAILRTGEKVVIKIQRPQLAEQIKQDIGVLRFLQPFLQRTTLGKIFNINQMVDAFSRQIKSELDFTVEALNLERFAQILHLKDKILVPGVHWAYTSSKVLTLDYMEGMKLDDFLATKPAESLRQTLSKKLVIAVMEPFFKQGVFHGDPHPGNILFTAAGELILLDYGIIGRLDEDFRYQAALLLTALKKFNAMEIVSIICTLGEVTRPVNNQLLFEDASQLVELVRGVNRGEVSFGKIIYSMIDIAVNHEINLPSSFFLFGKALIMTESVTRQLDSSINFIDEIFILAKAFLKEELNVNLSEEKLMLTSLAVLREQRQLPVHLAQLVKNLSAGKQKIIFSHQGLELMVQAINGSGGKIREGLIIFGLLISSAVLLSFGGTNIHLLLGGIWFSAAGLLIVRRFFASKLLR